MSDDQIRVKVKFFAGPREALGMGEIEMMVPKGTRVSDLIERLVDEYPVLASYARFLNVAVNRAYVSMQRELHDGDEVACLPPVGGG
jgi:molybdopterin converting factor subunit 1